MLLVFCTEIFRFTRVTALSVKKREFAFGRACIFLKVRLSLASSLSSGGLVWLCIGLSRLRIDSGLGIVYEGR